MTGMENILPEIGSTASSETKPEPTNLTSRDALISRLERGPEARAKFVDSSLNKHLAFQLRTMRDDKGWSQQETAQRAKMTQNAISRLENPFYGKATLTTLKRIAATHDVALMVTFVPFSQLVDWVSGTPYLEQGLRPESMHLPTFDEEMRLGAFFPQSADNTSSCLVARSTTRTNVVQGLFFMYAAPSTRVEELRQAGDTSERSYYNQIWRSSASFSNEPSKCGFPTIPSSSVQLPRNSEIANA